MSVFQFPGQKARKTAPDFRALAVGAVKALVSIALIAFLATRLNYTQVLSYWRVLNGSWILARWQFYFSRCARLPVFA